MSMRLFDFGQFVVDGAEVRQDFYLDPADIFYIYEDYENKGVTLINIVKGPAHQVIKTTMRMEKVIELIEDEYG